METFPCIQTLSFIFLSRTLCKVHQPATQHQILLSLEPLESPINEHTIHPHMKETETLRSVQVTRKEQHNLILQMAGQNDQALRRSVSDVSVEMDRISKDFNRLVHINEVERAECECCGMSEDYTPAYVSSIKDFYCGKWVCGLCSEAVKEHQNRTPKVPMNEALDSHMAFCKKYNRTTRHNPKLSLAEAMRDIAKRSSQHKNSKNFPLTKIARSTSCDPRIDFQIPPQRE